MFANKKLLTTLCPGDAYAHQATHTHSQPLFPRLCMILLLSLIGFGSAWADEVIITQNTSGFSKNNKTGSFTIADVLNVTFYNNETVGNSDSQFKFGATTNSIVITPQSGVTVTKVELLESAVSTKTWDDNRGVLSYQESNLTPASSYNTSFTETVTFTYTGTSNNYFSGIKVTYTIEQSPEKSSDCEILSAKYNDENGSLDGNTFKFTIPYGDTGNGDNTYNIVLTASDNVTIYSNSDLADNHKIAQQGDGTYIIKKSLDLTAGKTNAQNLYVYAEDNNTNKTWRVELVRGPKPVTGITLNKEKIYLEYNTKYQLTATATPDDATNKSISWSSNATDLASVDEAGWVTAKSTYGGTATITATAADGNGASAECTVYLSRFSETGSSTKEFTLGEDVSGVHPQIYTVFTDESGNLTLDKGDFSVTSSNNDVITGAVRNIQEGNKVVLDLNLGTKADKAFLTLTYNGSNTNYNGKSYVINYTVKLPKLAAPQFSVLETGKFEISNYLGNEAAYYYTLDGTDPTTSSNKLEWETVIAPGTYSVIKLFAVKDGQETEIATITNVTVKTTYSVSITAGEGGSATSNVELSNPIVAGTEITFAATPNSGYLFDNWHDGSQFITQNPYTTTVNADLNLTANFIESRTINVALATGCEPMGTVALYARDTTTPNLSGVEIKKNTNLDFTAIANYGYSFLGWKTSDDGSGDYVSSDAIYKIKAEGIATGATYYAYFAETHVDNTKVGEDNTTAFNSVHSEIKELAAGMTRHIEFKNYSDKADNWNNWILNVGSTEANAKNPDVMQLRADEWELIDNANTEKVSNFNWGTFKNDMDGATVAMDVTNSGKHIYVNAVITTSGGTKYNYSAISTDKLADATAHICLTVEKAHLTDLSIGEPVQAYELTYAMREFGTDNYNDALGIITIKNAQGLPLRKGTFAPTGEKVIYKAENINNPSHVFIKWASGYTNAERDDITVGTAAVNPCAEFLGKPGVTTPENIVTLTHPAIGTDGFKMYFTLDNSDPTTSANRYEYAPNTVAIRKINDKVRAVAYIDGVYSVIQGTNVTYEPVTVLEARGEKVAEHGTFTNSTCTTSIAIGNDNKAQWGISPNSEIEKSKVAYRSGSSSTATIQLTSTSAYKIVLSGYAGGSDPRTISSIYVDGTKLTEGTDFDIIRSTSNKSLRKDIADRIVITLKTGKEIAQNSDVTFNFSGTVCICYYEIYGTSKTEFCEMPEIIPESYNSTDNLWSYTLIPAAGTTMKYVVVDLSKGEPLAGYPKEATASVTISKSTEPNLEKGLMIRAWSVDPAGIKVASSKAFTTVESLLTPVIKYNVKNNTATYNNANSSWDPVEPKLVIYPATLTSAVTYTSDDTTIGNGENGTVNIVKGAGQGVCRITATVIVAEGNTEGLRPGTYNGILTLGIVDGYPNMLKKDQKPIVGESIAINDKSGEKVLTLTYGGWTHNPQNGNAWNYKDNDSRADDWPKAGTFDGTPIDGYEDQSQQNNDSRSELGKDGRIVWEDEGTYSKVHPFSLPCRGAYITLVPECNGILTIYLVQNGCINTNKDTHLATDLSGPRPYYWFDQSGNVVMPSSVTTKQKIKTGYDEKVFENGGNGVSTWMNNPELKPLVETYWPKTVDDVNDPYETAVKYRNGHLVFEKAYVKYIVNLCAGNTYYFFSNASKMGYAGLNFKPQTSVDILNMDGSVKKTVTTESDLVSLNQSQTFERPSSTTAYNKIQLANRSFAANTWNTICLPFAVSEAQVREVFGEGTQLIIYDGMNGNTAKFKYHVYQDILPGQAYLIKPTNTIESGNAIFKNVTISNDVEVVNNGTDGSDGTFKFVGTFDPVTVKAYDHVVSGNGKIGYFAQDVQMPGYRAYLLNNTGNTQTAAKISAISIGNAFDDEETTTEIMQLLIDDGVVFAPANGVYNINGQKVGNSTEGLPKGLYIVNGKKIFVR